MVPEFTFNNAKTLISNLQHKMKDTSIDKNLFTSSPNPLLNLCQMYELITRMKKSFFSLNNQCMLLLESVKRYILAYIDATDDLLYLSELMNEKDLRGKDSLELITQLELLDIIQLPKVEAVINRIYRSDYDSSGAFWE
jgi:hypothetical protein